MPLSESTIQELKQILQEDFGKELTPSEASEISYTLIGYFALLAKINHEKGTKNNNDDSAI